MEASFHNTPKLTGADLQGKQEKALALQKTVLEIFCQFKDSKFRAYDIEQLLIAKLGDANHDSVKRAITNLTVEEKLVKSKKAEAPGPYGVKVNVWQFLQKAA